MVLASGGYPGSYETGKPIQGLDESKGVQIDEGIHVFHAGTKREDGKLVTGGGRVLGVTGIGQNLKLAIDQTYRAVSGIGFEGVHYRKDIGHKALDRIAGGQKHDG